MDVEIYKKALKERGWIYKDLARETGISLTNISRIMAGIVKDPRQSTIEAIEQALGINLYNITPDEQAAGASATRRVNITPIEDELLYAFRRLGKKHGESTQRGIIDMIEKML